MKVKLLLTFLMVGFFNLFIFADVVTIDQARHVAKNIYYERTGVKQATIEFIEELTITDEASNPVYYVFNINKPVGFVIVTADDCVYPMLGYSTESHFDVNTTNPAQIGWMENYENQIVEARKIKLESSLEIKNLWDRYSQEYTSIQYDGAKGVDPLIDPIEWNQDGGWNAHCPADAAGPGGHAYAGCVATAMSMIMKYYNYPLHGSGTASYYCYPYGNISADFGAATYEWPEMGYYQPTDASAYVMFHAGVSVSMGYGPDGSGAQTSNAVTKMKVNFGYDNGAYFADKNSYPVSTWENMIKTNINDDMPLLYSGYPQSGAGHAFVLDGYDDESPTGYHFNWGWSGSSNGYFTISSLTPPGYNFSYNQAAGFELIPSQIFEAPTNLNITNDFNDITITWDAPASSEKSLAGYYVYKNFERVTDLLPVSQTEYTENDLPNGGYSYNVVAYYDSPEGYSSDLYEQKSIQLNYILHFTVLDEQEAPVSGAQVKVYTGTPVPITVNTNENGEANLTVQKFGMLDFEVVKAGFPEYEDSINSVDPDNYKTIHLPLATSTISKLGNKLYPNPTNSTITINLDSKAVENIAIMDMSGRIVLNDEIKNSNRELKYDLSNLAVGVYQIKVVTANKIYFDKLIIK